MPICKECYKNGVHIGGSAEEIEQHRLDAHGIKPHVLQHKHSWPMPPAGLVSTWTGQGLKRRQAPPKALRRQ